MNNLSKTEKTAFFSGNVFLLRGEIPDSVFDMLEANGAVHTPHKFSKRFADDKYKSFSFFKGIGVPQPETLKADGKDAKEQFLFASQKLGLPFIAKPRYGSMGRGVSLIENQKQLECALKKCKDLVFQSFIETRTQDKNRSDLRFFVIGGKVVASVLRIAKDSASIASNAHQGGIIQQFNASDALKASAVSIICNAGLDYGTADFLMPNGEPDKPLLCEINACPGFEALETQLNLNIAGQIVDYVLKLKQF
ncbi:MAG: ATP-grasp domain-containing protein [Spirochaetaceae bacterium]|nr:ATP-grasp domain-containing protein [Spirochaetaceae bacterium]